MNNIISVTRGDYVSYICIPNVKLATIATKVGYDRRKMR